MRLVSFTEYGKKKKSEIKDMAETSKYKKYEVS